MSAAAVERPHGERPLITQANRLIERNPGFRVEIIEGQTLVSPPPDGPHGDALTELMAPFMAAVCMGRNPG